MVYGIDIRKSIVVLIGFVLSISLLSASLTAVLSTNYYNRTYFQVLGNLCQEVIEKQPEAEQAILSSLKEASLKEESLKETTLKESSREKYKERPAASSKENILLAYGYRQTDFLPSSRNYSALFAATGFLVGGTVFLFTLILWHKKEKTRINALTDYLEKVNTGSSGVLFPVGEDAFSKLQDEIYKTVTELHQTRDAALKAKNNFAENLYNIAHQIKTPITSISLSTQMMQENPSSKHLEQIQRQLSRLTHLEESLLLLSRIDAGILSLERKEVDVFTVLMLATDNLQELFCKADVSVSIPESQAAVIYADLEWTMEAVMNLLKNCLEHTPPGGTVHCSYEQNPLYTQIRIQDTGNGFAKEDIPHLFERFYRGQNAKSNGIGIGLALSKAIIESQNGTISAGNPVDGGACFEIRFYSH